MRPPLIIAVTIALALGWPACGGDRSPTPTPTPIAPPSATPTSGAETQAGGAEDLLAQVTYFDLAMTLDGLREQAARWTRGEPDVLPELQELAERLRTLFRHVPWPSAVERSVTQAETALTKVTLALDAGDPAAAERALGYLSETLHDLGHDLSDEGLNVAGDRAATHVSFHALTMRLANFRGLVTRWVQGDAEAREEAREEAERIETLLDSTSWPVTLTGAVEGLDAAFHSVEEAAEAGDAPTASGDLAKLTEAAHDLARGFYEWLVGETPAPDHVALHVAFLDLMARLQEFDDLVQRGGQGDAEALEEATEMTEWIEALLDSVSWPPALTATVEALDTAFHEVEEALNAGDAAMATASLEALSTAFHELSHEVYEWLVGEA